MALTFVLMALAVALGFGALATGADWGFIIFAVVILSAGVVIYKDLAR